MINKKTNEISINKIEEMDTLEKNLQHAIDDLIFECTEESSLLTKHASMIITQLAMAAADLRVKKQNEIKSQV